MKYLLAQVICCAVVCATMAASATDWVGTYRGESIVDESIINPRYDSKQKAQMKARIPKIRATRLTLILNRDGTCRAVSQGGAVQGRKEASGTWKEKKSGVIVTLTKADGKMLSKPNSMDLKASGKTLVLENAYGENSKVIFRPGKG